MKGIYLILLIFIALSCQQEAGNFICPPCEQDCDDLFFTEDGICPHCNMNLIMRSDTSKIDQINLIFGSGNFLRTTSESSNKNIVSVFYHKPQTMSPKSKVLIVIPGAGRDGDAYRDSWVDFSERTNTLILSPSYSEESYDFGAYNMCGLIKNVSIRSTHEAVNSSDRDVWEIEDSDLEFEYNLDENSFLFNDFENLFESIKKAENLDAGNYDIFGHSAGGQILHRMTLFQKETKVGQIFAANSGSYTIPSFQDSLPFGIRNARLDSFQLALAFEKDLTILLGAQDDANHRAGIMLHTPTVDKQGLGRLERGKYFFNQSKEKAKEMNATFKWKLVVVPDVGHDQQKMSEAAIRILSDQ